MTMRDEELAQPCGRLTKRSEFKAVAAGRRFHTARMTVQSIARARQTGQELLHGIRIGLTVTRKAGHATERNRIRRRLRSAVRTAAPQWPCRDLDIVIVARREALSAPYPQLVEDLTRALPALTSQRQRTQ
jgi:ribonuclease P protein component